MSASSSPPTSPHTQTKERRTFYTLLGVPSTSSRRASPSSSKSTPSSQFDREHLWVTSPLFRNPFVFGALRIIVALYLTASAIVFLVDYVRAGNGDNYLSFFTNLCYIGLIAYFFASGVQTLSYAVRWRRNGAGAGYALQSWPRPLQALHVALYSTVVTFPFIVTVVYWTLLGGADVFSNSKRAWQGTSVHILNSLLACCELVFSNSPPPPWMALPITILCLAGYLGVAYVTYATQGFYTYSFLDPNETGSLLAAYICGILVAQIILFTLVHFIAKLRHWIALRYRRVISFERYPGEGFGSAKGSGSRERMTVKRQGDPETGEAGVAPRASGAERTSGAERVEGTQAAPPRSSTATATAPPRPSTAMEGRESGMYGVAYGGDEHDDELGGGWEEVGHPNQSRPDVAGRASGSVEGRAR